MNPFFLFCFGYYSSFRYMDGFQWTLKGKGGCLNFYFPSWTLDTVSKFVTAMIVVVLLGIITEWIARLRHDVSKHHRRMVVVGRRRRVSDRLWYLQTALHGMNALCAYILMLATMTYSLELLCCVISGLVIGYWIFGGDSYTHAGSPCCAFLDDDCDGSNNRDDGTVLTSEFLSTYVDGGNGNNTEGQGNVDDDGRYETNDPHSDVAATTATTAVDDWNNNGTTTTSATGGGSCCGSHNKV